MTIQIAGRDVGHDCPPFIIAEIGVNHDGSPDLALELVDAAADSGADAVKTQFFRADLLMSRAARLADYQRAAGESDPIDMLRRLELPLDAMSAIVDRAHCRGLAAIVTVFSLELVAPAARLPWDAFKTASPDIINRPLIEALAADGRPLIASTGAADMEEVLRACAWLPRGRAMLMQCVSAYPTPDESAAIGGVGALARATDLPVGYSDHTTALDTGALAAAAGACALEKHLTHDRAAAGPDHAASLDAAQFAEYVRLARRAHSMLGPREKRILDIEQDVRSASRQSIVAVRAMKAGHVLTRGDLTLKRPAGASSLAPDRLADIIGRMLVRDVEADAPLSESDLAPARPSRSTPIASERAS